MPGLAFLAKKSWHTSNLNNQEKVWIAEQKKAAEEAKTKELAKQIAQEREQEDLEKIAGTQKRLDRGIDWMYEGGGAERTEEMLKQKEEFLLGKEYNFGGKSGGGDFATAASANTGVALVVTSASTMDRQINPETTVKVTPVEVDEDDYAGRNEDFRLRHEDPMFFVSQKRQEKEEHEEKRRALLARVMGPTASKPPIVSAAIDGMQNEGKMNRKNVSSRSRHDGNYSRGEGRKKEKKRRRQYDDAMNESGEESRDKKSKKHHRNKRRSGHSCSRSRSRSLERLKNNSESRDIKKSSRHPHASSHIHTKKSRDNNHEDRRHRHHSHNDRTYSQSRSQSIDRGRLIEGHVQRLSSERRLSDRTDRHEKVIISPHMQGIAKEEAPVLDEPTGYGLQGSSFSDNAIFASVAPDMALVAKKRQEKEEAKRRKYRRGDRRREMTDEERATALREMQIHAHSREEERATRKTASSRWTTDEDCGGTAELKNQSSANNGASFLKEMAARTHGIMGGNNDTMTMATRVARNRHTNQKKESDSFL